MNTLAKNIYRQNKYPWKPLFKFGGARSRDVSDGWHASPYNSPGLRTIGVRWKDASGNVVKNSVAYRGDGTYQNAVTNLNYTCEVNYDASKMVALWYRYSNISDIIYPLYNMPDLKLISFRGNSIDFLDCNVSSCYQLSHFEISNADGLVNTINTVSFHPDAPIKFAYLDVSFPQVVKDTVLTQAYNHRNTPNLPGMSNQKQLIAISGYSASLQYMVDELVNNYAWSIS